MKTGNKRNKIAVVSDGIIKYGGAERVLETILKIYPNSDLYTLFITPGAKRRIKGLFPNVDIKTSWNQIWVWSDQISKYISIIKLWANHYWRSLNLDDYDLVISSSHSFGSKNVKVKNNKVHISYVHTPPRYLYKEFSEIAWVKNRWVQVLFKFVWNKLRKVDFEGAKNQILIANSETVRKRIKKYYKEEAEVIYPPISVGKYVSKKKGDNKYFLCFSRLVKQKGIDLAVKVCTKNNWSLVVVGNGPELKNLKRIAGEKVKFIVNCNDSKKIKLMKQAEALIYPSIEEDFGMVPVEAMALGTPVIGHKSGGVMESVVNGQTGILFKQFSVDSLESAIKKFVKSKWIPRRCHQQATKFRESVFVKRFKELVKEKQSSDKLIPTIKLWNIPFCYLNLKATAELIIKWAKAKSGKTVFCCGLNDVFMAQDNRNVVKILKQGDLITADGMPVVWKIRRQVKRAERVYGPDLMRSILSKSKQDNLIKHFLLGGSQENLDKLENKIKEDFKGINIAGRYSPSFCEVFEESEIDKMVQLIKKSRANIVWLGLGAQKQIILADILKKRLSSGVLITVGAAFDFLAGTKKQCPKFIRNHGGEWLFRWINEPRRLSNRYKNIIKFLLKEIKNKYFTKIYEHK